MLMGKRVGTTPDTSSEGDASRPVGVASEVSRTTGLPNISQPELTPRELANDALSLERFTREAKAIAALNHPNIVTIYSVEQVEDLNFITMELVAGQTLKELLR
ncbi:MAG: hypothetical protein BMS9Abin37_2137 [Acidobacteriota bacterium]|nr:MAG: hypothetical protein BMS9Abin37_2137 [Acidobacteriota bacterium]